MPGFPCCCTMPPLPPPGDPRWWPPGTPPSICDTDPCADDLPTCDGFNYAGCDDCVAISLTLSSDTDPMGCPCDQVIALTGRPIGNEAFFGCAPAWCAQFEINTESGCDWDFWLAVVTLPGSGTGGATISLYRGNVDDSWWDYVAGMTVATPDPSECRDITYNFSHAGIHIDGVFCIWTDASAAFSACA